MTGNLPDLKSRDHCSNRRKNRLIGGESEKRELTCEPEVSE